MWLFALLIGVPIIEIALFIQVGGAIGLGWTLLIVLLTAVIGTYLMRMQGFAVLKQLRESMEESNNPAQPLLHGALILVAGLLMLTPGFFTDSVGFALLVPPLRNRLIQWGISRFMQSGIIFTHREAHRPGPIDGDYTILDDDTGQPGNSGWTRPNGN